MRDHVIARQMMHKRFDHLLIDNGFEIKPFRELELPYQMAMAHYMAIDGEAWITATLDDALGAALSKPLSDKRLFATRVAVLEYALPSIVSEYGDTEFGTLEMPTEDVAREIVKDPTFVESNPEATFETYMASLRKKCRVHPAYPNHSDTGRWPVIWSSEADETLQDGWHRFQSYAQSGHETTPIIFYPRPRHRTLLAKMADDAPRAFGR
jgi:hypothetical protein